MSTFLADFFQYFLKERGEKMNLLEKIQELCKENGMNPSKLEIELGFGKGTLYKWGKSSPNTDKLSKVADYFGVSLDYLIGKTDIRQTANESNWKPQLTSKDDRDIKKELNSILEELESSEETLMYDGEPMDDLTKELFRNCLENALKVAKLAAKEKYTPKKYRK